MRYPSCESPPAGELNDEQRAFDQMNAIIEILLAADPETRYRVYQTVGAFFGYDVPRR